MLAWKKRTTPAVNSIKSLYCPHERNPSWELEILKFDFIYGYIGKGIFVQISTKVPFSRHDFASFGCQFFIRTFLLAICYTVPMKGCDQWERIKDQCYFLNKYFFINNHWFCADVCAILKLHRRFTSFWFYWPNVFWRNKLQRRSSTSFRPNHDPSENVQRPLNNKGPLLGPPMMMYWWRRGRKTVPILRHCVWTISYYYETWQRHWIDDCLLVLPTINIHSPPLSPTGHINSCPR